MDIESMKNAWTNTTRNFEKDDNYTELMAELINKRRVTSLDGLKRRYLMFAIISLICIPLFGFYMGNSNMIPKDKSLIVSASFAIYFLIASIMDWFQYFGIDSVDPLRMSVSEVIEKVKKYRKRHLIFVAILLPMAFTLVGFFAYCMDFDKSLMTGVVCGICFGLVIGTIQLLKFMRDYRKIS